jgi:hypothetical protein
LSGFGRVGSAGSNGVSGAEAVAEGTALGATGNGAGRLSSAGDARRFNTHHATIAVAATARSQRLGRPSLDARADDPTYRLLRRGLGDEIAKRFLGDSRARAGPDCGGSSWATAGCALLQGTSPSRDALLSSAAPPARR